MKRKSQQDVGGSKQSTLHTFLSIKPHVKWSLNQSVLVGQFGDTEPTTRVAAFDFDGTIATVKGNYSFPKSGDDWQWLNHTVPGALNSLSKAGYTLVIFSNQKGIEDSKQIKRKSAFVGRIENTIKHLTKYCASKNENVPAITILAATRDDIFRKPRTGMWSIFKLMYPDFSFDVCLSFYCGDAADKRVRMDHNDTDRKWALNLGLNFYLPEQIFNEEFVLKINDMEHHSEVIPVQKLADFDFDPRYHNIETKYPDLSSFDMIVCVGSPASGKSSFCQTHLSSFTRINQDTIKSFDSCLKAAKIALNQGLKVVIDNTNPKIDTRRAYLDLAKGCKIACVWMNASKNLCFHNNGYREHNTVSNTVSKNIEGHSHIPRVAINIYWSSLQPPNIDEGFDRIFQVPFKQSFADAEHESQWRLFWD